MTIKKRHPSCIFVWFSSLDIKLQHFHRDDKAEKCFLLVSAERDGTRNAALPRLWASVRAAAILQRDKSFHASPILSGRAVSLPSMLLGAPLQFPCVTGMTTPVRN